MNSKYCLILGVSLTCLALPAFAAEASTPASPASVSVGGAPTGSSASLTVAPAAASGSAGNVVSAPAAAMPSTPRPAANATIHWTPDAPDKIVNVSPTDASAPPLAITPDKHIELFNGKDFTGWEFNMQVGRSTVAAATADWSLGDGMIKCVGKPNGYIRTAQAYKDYKVTVEWRFPPGKAGNTGVMVHMTAPEMMSPWPKCVECQGLHSFMGDFWFWNGATCDGLATMPVEKLRDGKKNGIARPGPDVEKPVGEWNTYAVVCAGDTVTIFVNDQQVNKITGCNLTSGYIGLQSEGAGLEIRKVSLDPLPKADAKGN